MFKFSKPADPSDVMIFVVILTFIVLSAITMAIGWVSYLTVLRPQELWINYCEHSNVSVSECVNVSRS